MHHVQRSHGRRTAFGITGVALLATALTGGGALAQDGSPVPRSAPGVVIDSGPGLSEGGTVVVGGEPMQAAPGVDQAGPTLVQVAPNAGCASWQTVTVGPDGAIQQQGGADATCPQGGPVVIGQAGPGPWVIGGIGAPGGPAMVDLGDATRLVTVTAINGSTVSLVTKDGWSRDLDTANVVITLDGATLTSADLAVGDTVQVDQTRNANDTYTITGLEVVLPQLAGVVATVGTDSFTLSQSDGTITTVHVSDTTKWPAMVPGQAPMGLAGLTAGELVFARGKLEADGTMDASSVTAGGAMTGSGMGGPTITVTPVPVTTPAPSASPQG